MQFLNPNTAPQYATPERMKQVWQVQLDLTRKFKEVCQRHGLQFWMDSGTILGAVRHQGYIPWDDDIDLAMPRADYDKLNKIAAQEFTHPYFWQTTYSDRNFFCGHAILRNAETAEFNQSEMDKGYCLGIGVDVFVIDGVVSNPVGYALHRAAAKMLNKWTRSLIAHSCSWLSY